MMEKMANDGAKIAPNARAGHDSVPSETHWIVNTSICYRFAETKNEENTNPSAHTLYIGFSSPKSAGEDVNSFIVPQDPKKHLRYFTSQIDTTEKGIEQALAKSRPVFIVWPKDTSSNERDFGIGFLLVALCKFQACDYSYVHPYISG